jgi:hypothetical protein
LLDIFHHFGIILTYILQTGFCLSGYEYLVHGNETSGHEEYQVTWLFLVISYIREEFGGYCFCIFIRILLLTGLFVEHKKFVGLEMLADIVQWNHRGAFLFSSLRIKSLYMFRALLAHPQEVLHKRNLVYCLRVISVGCTWVEVELVQPMDITRTQYTKCRLWSTSWGWASNPRNM